MNLLAGCERSIVTDLAGTTRDVVEETVLLGEIPLRLADTAGIRETEDRVERIGVQIALERVKTAQFVLAVFDASEALNDDDRAMMEAIGDTPCVAVVNKSDLPAAIDMAAIEARFPATASSIRSASARMRKRRSPALRRRKTPCASA